MFELLKPVKAEIRVIIGNNEERIIRDLFNDDINAFIKFCENYNVKAMVDDYITFEGYEFYINHYPRKHKNEYINLFGHVHRVTGLWKPYVVKNEVLALSDYFNDAANDINVCDYHIDFEGVFQQRQVNLCFEKIKEKYENDKGKRTA